MAWGGSHFQMPGLILKLELSHEKLISTIAILFYSIFSPNFQSIINKFRSCFNYYDKRQFLSSFKKLLSTCDKNCQKRYNCTKIGFKIARRMTENAKSNELWQNMTLNDQKRLFLIVFEAIKSYFTTTYPHEYS